MAKTILLSSFDAFGEGKEKGKENQSRIVAKLLQERFKNTDIKIHHCELRTVYYKSAETLKDCYNSLPEKPDFVISLGEGYCDSVYFNIRAGNLMQSETADNDGVVFKHNIIRKDGPKKIYTPLNLKLTYKKLSKRSRSFIKNKKNTGTFVCNNLSYIMSNDLEETPYSFIHIPDYSCKNLKYKTKRSVEVIAETLEKL